MNYTQFRTRIHPSLVTSVILVINGLVFLAVMIIISTHLWLNLYCSSTELVTKPTSLGKLT